MIGKDSIEFAKDHESFCSLFVNAVIGHIGMMLTLLQHSTLCFASDLYWPDLF